MVGEGHAGLIETTDDAPSLPRQPALDGLRAVAVAMVLLFHAGVPWMSGGYLGVSVFFTLSGFLITSLLRAEVVGTGTVRVGAFYARRARRLLPASIVCLAAIAIGGPLGAWQGVAHLERDLLGAVLQVANWVRLLAGESYGDLLQTQAGRVSPLDHYWSLAIEEQLYWVWPLAIGGLARHRAPSGWSRTRAGATLVAGLCAPAIAWRWGPDAAYWATPARAAEVLAGATLACLLAEGRLRRPPGWLAPAALAALLAGAATLPARGGFAFHGGLPLVAVGSAGLLYGLQGPGPVRSLLAAPPLVGLGRISYGVYLYHWPIYAWLDEPATGRSGWALTGLRVVVTLVAASVSYIAVERPIRQIRWQPLRTLAWATPAVVAVAVAAVVLVPDLTTTYGPDPAAAAAAAIRPVSPTAPLRRLVVRDLAPSRPVRIMVIGDSTAQSLGAGMVAWANANPTLAQVTVRAGQGCGFVRSGQATGDVADSWPAACDRLFAGLPDDLRTARPDLVLLYVTSRDTDPRSWDGGPPRTPEDATFRQHAIEDYRAFTDLVLAVTPATVVWVRPPMADPYWRGDPEVFHNPRQHRALDAVRAAAAAPYPARVRLLDVRARLEAIGMDADRSARPDGIHLTPVAAEGLTTSWLGPLLIRMAG